MDNAARIERDIDAALETASNCRLAASQFKQMGFSVLTDWHTENAKAAERWAVVRARETGR